MVDGQDGLSLEAVLSLVDLEVKNMLDLVAIPNQPMVVKHVQAQLQNQRAAWLSIVQLMVDGQVGLSLEAVPKLVELEVRSMLELVLILNHSMVVALAQAQLQNPKTVTHMPVHTQ